MSLRSPLGRVLGMGSAKSGTEHWVAQRLSALALIPLGLWFLFSLLLLPGLDYISVRAWLARPFSGLLAALLVVALAYHSYLGVCVVVEDYVHAPGMKLASLISLRFLHILAGAAGLIAILHIAIGS